MIRTLIFLLVAALSSSAFASQDNFKPGVTVHSKKALEVEMELSITLNSQNCQVLMFRDNRFSCNLRQILGGTWAKDLELVSQGDSDLRIKVYNRSLAILEDPAAATLTRAEKFAHYQALVDSGKIQLNLVYTGDEL